MSRPSSTTRQPLIGITADATPDKHQVGRSYVRCVRESGGVPVILPGVPDCAAAYVERLDGFLFTGGDDPDTRQWGVPMHPKATAMNPDRQRFETELLRLLDQMPKKPVLGVCLGMQLMGLHAGGRLEQHLPDVLATAADHWDRREHGVSGVLGRGAVHSHHRQALSDPGRLEIVARADDGVIEAVRAKDRPFYLGVQWHPERTENQQLGVGLIRNLVEFASAGAGI